MRQSLVKIYRPARPVLCLISLAAAVVSDGCSDKRPYRCVPVSGNVTYQDGSLIPADQIHLTFISQTPPVNSTPPKYGAADADGKTGRFDFATTYTPRDGLIAGQHKVIVQCIGKGHVRSDLVPAEYGDAAKTPLTVETDKLPLELKVRKPGHSASAASR